MAYQPLLISGQELDLTALTDFMQKDLRISLHSDVKNIVNKSREVITSILKSDHPVYGVNTGFGNFAEVRIKPQTVAELQQRLVLSHAAGVGDPIPLPIVRMIMLLKIKSLSRGYSGCRFDVITLLTDMLNHDIIPLIPQKGSVGASGDLAPLAHLALVMIGRGKAFTPANNGGDWTLQDGKEALASAGLNPIVFEAKEGLAILNGTQAMTAYGIYNLIKSYNLVKCADIIGAMSLEALLGTLTPFDKRIHDLRKHTGQAEVAENIRRILKGSPIVLSHKFSDHKVQDAYSLRCIPQVHGAVRAALEYIKDVLIIEANGVTDNPLVFPESGEVLSGGNFHGAPVAQVCDLLAIALSDLASISERRIEHLLDPSVSQLPAFLTDEGGLNSGFMIAQVTAASLVTENKNLSHPASVDSIPTSANKEDHVSMGMYAARKASEVISNLEYVLAVEMMCAAQALDFRHPLVPSPATKKALDLIRNVIPKWENDRFIHNDIVQAQKLIVKGKLVSAVESICGRLH